MDTLFKLISLILFPFLIGIYLPDRESILYSSEEFEFNHDHLDGRFTGGFGEQTCHSCHFDYDINMDGGSLTVQGLPKSYKAGQVYEVKVTVESVQLENGGFQMTARFQDGSQAGEFKWNGNRLIYTPNISDQVKYLQHGPESTNPTGDREVSWSFNWVAPESASGDIIFNISANAGNNDDSSFGDWIYIDELISNPGK